MRYRMPVCDGQRGLVSGAHVFNWRGRQAAPKQGNLVREDRTLRERNAWRRQVRSPSARAGRRRGREKRGRRGDSHRHGENCRSGLVGVVNGEGEEDFSWLSLRLILCFAVTSMQVSTFQLELIGGFCYVVI